MNTVVEIVFHFVDTVKTFTIYFDGDPMAAKKQRSSKPRSNYSTQTLAVSSRKYHSYLLRIWREDDLTPWRIQIENPHTHEVIGFQNIEKLVCFLNEQGLRSEGGTG